MRLKFTVLVCALIALTVISGCGNKSKPRLAPFQEPVEPLPYPKDQGARELTRLWKESIDVDKNSTYARLKPAIFNQQVIVASNKGEVNSYAIDSGNELWQTDLDEAVYAGVNVANGLATVALENGEIVLLNAENGKVIWRQALGRQVSATPAIGDTFIIVRSVDGLLLGLDINSGRLRWQQQLRATQLGIHAMPEPIVVNNAVLVGMPDGVLSALSSQDGSIYWVAQIGQENRQSETLNGIYAPPLLAGNLVIASNFGQQLAAFRLQSGEGVWSLPLSTYQPMTINSEFLFITDELGTVQAINALNGQVIWQQGAFKGRGVSYPQVIGNRVIIGDNQGNLHLLDLVTGGVKQSLQIAKGPIRHLHIEQQQILAFTSYGELFSYKWQLPEEDSVQVQEVDLQDVPAVRKRSASSE